MKRVKTAILGVGFIGKAHIEAIRRLGYIDIVAVGLSSQQEAERAAEALDIPKAYGHYLDLLQDEEIEVLHNCTPNHLHYEINKQALLHNKHLLSEKPLTRTSQEAQELYELAKNKNLTTGINFNYRQFPMVQHLKSMVKDGDIGKVRIIRGSYLQDWLLYETDYNWRMEKKYGGETRAISDIGSHLYDLVQYVTGLTITEVMADSAIVIPRRYRSTGKSNSFTALQSTEMIPVEVENEDYCTVMVKFNNGASGVLTVSQVSAGYKNALEIHLDGAVASGSWKQEEPFVLHMGYRDKPGEKITRDPSLVKKEALPFLHYPGGHEEGWTDSLKNMMHHFYQAIRMKTPMSGSVASFREGLQIMLINDAIVRSARSGRWEKVCQVDEKI